MEPDDLSESSKKLFYLYLLEIKIKVVKCVSENIRHFFAPLIFYATVIAH